MTPAPPIQTHTFGFLPYNKPHGMTSRQLVNRVQRRLRRELNDRKLKVGHTGTLDPLADGLVIIAVGAAARLTPWLLQHAKRYVARFELGVSSASGDLEEPVTALVGAPQPSPAEILQACHNLQGWIEQTPPGHSAIWVDGERAHHRVRRGEQVDMPTRRVWIDSITVIRYEYPYLDVDVRCGSGTYLRSLGMDIAAQCQSVAVMTQLTRSEVGPYELAAAVTELPPSDPAPSDGARLGTGLTAMAGIGELRNAIQSPILGLAHLPSLQLDDVGVSRLRYGLSVTGQPQMPSQLDVDRTGYRAESASHVSGNAALNSFSLEECVAVDSRGDLVAVLRPKRGNWAPYRVFAASR